MGDEVGPFLHGRRIWGWHLSCCVQLELHATGKMPSPYPPTMKKRPDLVAHRHRPDPPDIMKITSLTIVRICPHQSSAASSSATTRSRPVMTASATKVT